MNRICSMLLAALASAVIAGCASGPKYPYHAGDENPPDFLTGPAAALLTNTTGFSARLTASLPGPGNARRTVKGDLIGREGSLIFQPSSPGKGKRKLTEGGMFFIWNETSHSGYVLNDPLQAYAPLTTGTEPARVTLNTSGAVEEEANGHPCRRLEAVVECSDGSTARFTVWEAEDARHFPVRIRTSPGSREMTLDLSDIRLDMPAPQLFNPPDGFTKYGTSVALMNALLIRQTTLTKDSGRPAEAPDSSAIINNWRPNTP